MADTLTSRPCKGCRTPFTPKRTTGRSPSYCEACVANKCPSCKRRGGRHAPRCGRAAPGGRPTKKKATGGGTSRKPTPAPAVRRSAPVAVAARDNGARALLVESLEEELVQKRAEVRVLESMLAKAGGGA